MEIDDLRSELEQIASKEKKLRSEAIKKYCLANNYVKIGDIVQSNSGGDIIKVEKITFSAGIGSFSPECIYEGVKLKKDLTPRVDGKRHTVFQSRMLRHIPV